MKVHHNRINSAGQELLKKTFRIYLRSDQNPAVKRELYYSVIYSRDYNKPLKGSPLAHGPMSIIECHKGFQHCSCALLPARPNTVRSVGVYIHIYISIQFHTYLYMYMHIQI